jgi:hypothetical protein
LFASRPQLMGRVLGIVSRAISSHLIQKAGFTRKTAQTGAVTLIQKNQGKSRGHPKNFAKKYLPQLQGLTTNEDNKEVVMTRARESLVCLESTPYYHCISRCVRRAWLCGEDPYTGQSFEHRRQWVLDRMRELVDIFAIDVCAYAILSNHFHIVLHVDVEKAKDWTDRQVIE